MNNFENNSAWGYYPEDMIFDEKSQSFQIKKNNDKKEQVSKDSAQGHFSTQNFLSKMFEGNEMISSLLKGGINPSLKNNIFMQALSSMRTDKKESKIEKTRINSKDFFEEL